MPKSGINMKLHRLAVCAAALAVAAPAAQAEHFPTPGVRWTPPGLVAADLRTDRGDLAAASPWEDGDARSIEPDTIAGTDTSIEGTAFTDASVSGPERLDASQSVDPDAATAKASPERDTYAFMLGGLGVVVWVARRRRME